MSIDHLRGLRAAVAGMGLAAAALAGAQALAQQPPAGPDPHAVYETRCQSCHFEHAADLARLKLRLDGETLVVKNTGKPLEPLLKRHHGISLTGQDWAAVAALFRLGLTTGGVFQYRCGRCHGRAVAFAREKLAFSEGRVVTRAGQREVAAFLTTHGEATAEEITRLIQALTFHLQTAPK